MVKPNMIKSQPPMIGPRRPDRAQTAARRGPIESGAWETGAHSTALYIAQITAELAELAHFAGLALLSYLLHMARLEAEIHCLPGTPEFHPADEASGI